MYTRSYRGVVHPKSRVTVHNPWHLPYKIRKHMKAISKGRREREIVLLSTNKRNANYNRNTHRKHIKAVLKQNREPAGKELNRGIASMGFDTWMYCQIAMANKIKAWRRVKKHDIPSAIVGRMWPVHMSLWGTGDSRRYINGRWVVERQRVAGLQQLSWVEYRAWHLNVILIFLQKPFVCQRVHWFEWDTKRLHRGAFINLRRGSVNWCL